MEQYIFQGGKEISEDELVSHMASLCQLENVGVLLGAGSSVGAGGKTMEQVWESAQCRFPDIAKELARLNIIDSQNADNNEINVELIIDQVNQFLVVHRKNPKKDNSDIEILEKALLCLYQSVTEAAMLIDVEKFGAEAVGKGTEFDFHRELFEKLISNRQPGQSAPMLFTTNYDLSLEWAAEEIGIQLINGFSGIHTRTFQPQNFDLSFRNVKASGEARFGHYHAYLHKLHGSLSWTQSKEGETRELPAAMVKELYLKPLLAGQAIYEEQFLIYPGANKYHHTIGFVYGELFRRFSEYLSQPQTVLFVNGYGFGDYHINRILMGALLNPSLHIVIFYPELGTISADQDKQTEAQKCVAKLKSMSLNQITIVGGADKAYFNSFVTRLPRPVLFPKDSTRELAKAIGELAESKKTI